MIYVISVFVKLVVLCYKANYILYTYFTEITSGVRTFGGNQSVCLQEPVLVDCPSHGFRLLDNWFYQ